MGDVAFEDPTFIALASIKKTISKLWDEGIGSDLPVRQRMVVPRERPEVKAVVEDLFGAAFAIAQARVRATTPKPARATEIEHVANFWKHRDEWPADWTTGMVPTAQRTAAAIRAMGVAPPVQLGQMTTLVERVLGHPGFDPMDLWLLTKAP